MTEVETFRAMCDTYAIQHLHLLIQCLIRRKFCVGTAMDGTVILLESCDYVRRVPFHTTHIHDLNVRGGFVQDKMHPHMSEEMNAFFSVQQ
jgi:hypothetical protein